jgi:hypothetical protein
MAFGIAGCRVLSTGPGVHDDDRSLRHAGARRVDDGAANRSGGGVLSGELDWSAQHNRESGESK